MKITSIKRTSNNKYQLMIDNKKHLLYEDVIIKYNLLKSQDITDNLYKTIIEDNIYYDYYNKILKYITFKMRTEKEVYLKLTTLGASKRLAFQIINQLKEKKYLDNNKYLEYYIKDQINLTLNGPLKIKNNIVKSGFNEKSINDYLSKIDPEIWQERASRVIDKKIKTIKGSKTSVILKLKVYLNSIGYNEKHYQEYLKNISINDDDSLKKDYKKYYEKLSKKYSGSELDFKLKQKLYLLGYDTTKILQNKKN